MHYFNGFSLRGEEEFFREMLVEGEFVVAGFSYGAQKAFEYAYGSSERVDRLILLSPAFFQHQKKSFIKTQLRYFKADAEAYRKEFLKNVAYPSTHNLTSYLTHGEVEELEELLTYQWESERIEELQKRGVTIEVFLGGQDKIVDSEEAYSFFSELTTTYLFKEQGHLLA